MWKLSGKRKKIHEYSVRSLWKPQIALGPQLIQFPFFFSLLDRMHNIWTHIEYIGGRERKVEMKFGSRVSNLFVCLLSLFCLYTKYMKKAHNSQVQHDLAPIRRFLHIFNSFVSLVKVESATFFVICVVGDQVIFIAFVEFSEIFFVVENLHYCVNLNRSIFILIDIDCCSGDILCQLVLSTKPHHFNYILFCPGKMCFFPIIWYDSVFYKIFLAQNRFQPFNRWLNPRNMDLDNGRGGVCMPVHPEKSKYCKVIYLKHRRLYWIRVVCCVL